MGLDIPLPVLIMIVIGILAVGGLVIGVFNERKRRESIQRVANELGLDYYQDGDPDLLYRLSDLPLFSKGRSKRITNMIHGESDDVVLGLFDYRYTTGSGKNSHTYRQTVVFFEAADLSLPVFELRPQSLFHGIGKMFGYQDIDFDSHPIFSKAFILRGPSEKQIRTMFNPELLTSLEQKQGICLEGRQQQLVFYRPSKRYRPDQLRDLLGQGFAILSLLRTGGQA